MNDCQKFEKIITNSVRIIVGYKKETHFEFTSHKIHCYNLFQRLSNEQNIHSHTAKCMYSRVLRKFKIRSDEAKHTVISTLQIDLKFKNSDMNASDIRL